MNTADPDQLGRPALNRATLDRQLLLRRHPMPARRAVAHLVGPQAQASLASLGGRFPAYFAGDLR